MFAIILLLLHYIIVDIATGDAADGTAGAVSVVPGVSTVGDGATVTLTGGSATAHASSGGEVKITGGEGSSVDLGDGKRLQYYRSLTTVVFYMSVFSNLLFLALPSTNSAKNCINLFHCVFISCDCDSIVTPSLITSSLTAYTACDISCRWQRRRC